MRDRKGGGVWWLIVGLEVTQIVYQLIPYLLGSIGHIRFSNPWFYHLQKQ